MDTRTKVQGVVGVLKAEPGLFGSRSQRLVKKLCDTGSLLEVRWAVAMVLLGAGMARGSIPANAGKLDTDLQDRCRKACEEVVEEYTREGGVLTAKGYALISEVVSDMLKQWSTDFVAPIPVSARLVDTVSDEEFNARFSLAVQLSVKILLEDNRVGSIQIVPDELEGMVRKVVRATLRAFEAPNEVNHELIHGT